MNLCWFRTDLRVRDNPALVAAAAGGKVAGLYIATPGQWQKHADAPIKRDFWRRNLADLESRLQQQGIPLLFFQVQDYADIPGLFRALFDAWPVSSLSFNGEYPLNERRRDEAVIAVCRDRDITCRIFHDQVMLQPGSILNGSGQPFRVFTPFARKCRAMIHAVAVEEPALAGQGFAGKLKRVSGQCALDGISWPKANSGWSRLWPAGEAEARARLAKFTGGAIREYKTRRDFPALDGTSSLSPWLNAGVLSIRDCWIKATSRYQGEGPETWKNELLWREFYRHILFHFPHVSMGRDFRPDYGYVRWRHAEKDFNAWCEGRTGIPVVDAAMRQLLETGWMHNRLRMITAMFLAKHLLIDWRRGERWFMQHLIDGDFAANNGGWQWSASTGTDAVPYFRVFNPVTQSRRFDEQGNYIRRYLPELAHLDDRSIHEPGLHKPQAYPPPLVDLKAARERAIAAFRKSSPGA